MTDAVSFGSLLRLVVSLGVIIGVLLLVRRWAVRGHGPARGMLRVVARVPLGRSSSVAVVAMGDQHYLVGVAEQGVTLIDRVDGLIGPDADPEPETAQVRTPDLVTDDTWPRTGLVDRARRMTLRAPGRARGDAFDV